MHNKALRYFIRARFPPGANSYINYRLKTNFRFHLSCSADFIW